MTLGAYSIAAYFAANKAIRLWPGSGEKTEIQNLVVTQEGDCLWITMNRPEQLNALNRDMVMELRQVFTELYWRRDVRVVVISGAGRAFCAGLDLKERSNGVASGGGFAIALASDVRIATPSARMNATFIRIGLSACDIGVSYFLPRMVGSSVAAEYLLTGRFIDPVRARELGLVSRVVGQEALMDEGRGLVADMLHATPLGLRLTKEALNHAIDAGSLEAVIAMEDRNQVLTSQTEDFREGVAAFIEKRPPHYSNQ